MPNSSDYNDQMTHMRPIRTTPMQHACSLHKHTQGSTHRCDKRVRPTSNKLPPEVSPSTFCISTRLKTCIHPHSLITCIVIRLPYSTLITNTTILYVILFRYR